MATRFLLPPAAGLERGLREGGPAGRNDHHHELSNISNHTTCYFPSGARLCKDPAKYSQDAVILQWRTLLEVRPSGSRIRR